MPDTRTPDDLVAMIVLLEQRLNDLESTMVPRMARASQTGDIEPTLLIVPKTNTLFLNGQTVARASYPILWQWAVDNGLVTSNLFTVGDGSSTFGLPNFVGKVPVGSGTLGGDVYPHGSVAGSTTRSIGISNMPNHDHNVGGSSSSSGSHSHGFSTSSIGNHGGHNSGSTGVASAAPGAQDFFFSVASSTGNGGGGHNHSGTTDTESSHSHSFSVSESAVGGGIPLDVRQISIAVNWLIWT